MEIETYQSNHSVICEYVETRRRASNLIREDGKMSEGVGSLGNVFICGDEAMMPILISI